MLRVSKDQIIFDGDYFTDYLYLSCGWIYWGKRMGGDFSDGELAWTNFDRTLKEFQFCSRFGGKEHPTQKPAELFRWIPKNHSSESALILDPFLGSGTTSVAAKMEGRKYLGVEISVEYCEIACRRVAGTPIPLFPPEKMAA
jgi:site-specific DNA-methyltransferase (adenine-specific)